MYARQTNHVGAEADEKPQLHQENPLGTRLSDRSSGRVPSVEGLRLKASTFVA
jgi:hypothetical protein